MDAHPLLVHFPIVLILAGISADLYALATGRSGYHAAGLRLFAAGAAFAIAAALTGESAAEAAGRIPGIGEDLAHHERLATGVAWMAPLLTLVRAHLAVRRRFAGARRILWIVLGVVCGALTGLSGYSGGRLVHKFGAGTLPAAGFLAPAVLPGP